MARNLKRLRSIPARALYQGLIYLFGGALLLGSGLSAQEGSRDNTAKDRYRVELLLFTLRNPADNERMDGAKPPPVPVGAELLKGPRSNTAGNRLQAPADGEEEAADSRAALGDFSQTLLRTEGLHLTGARNRLRNSGRYDIALFAAWEEAFPPGHKTPPLVVRLGDSEGEHSDIEGHIQIERQRYLHVTAQLYDLDLNPPLDENKANAGERDGIAPLLQDLDALQNLDRMHGQPEPGPDVVTWMRETRRMRSGEVHFLDSPTMGLLVYFEPLK